MRRALLVSQGAWELGADVLPEGIVPALPGDRPAGHSLEESLELESAMMTKTGATADHRAAVAAFVAKEKPVFEGR